MDATIGQIDPVLFSNFPVASSSVIETEANGYARLLLPKKRGLPLWQPQPINMSAEYQKQGVSIGDVGLITAGGAFDFQFNIYDSLRHHPLNNVHVPEHFIPLARYNPQADITHETVDCRGSAIFSDSIQRSHQMESHLSEPEYT